MNTSYSSERGIQILISLLKQHNIKKLVTSPGTTNMMLNASLMYDGCFEMYSCVDERGAAYMACGLAEESGEPVVIICTGATAARNYYPGLTEAYYRKLPILAVTGTQDLRRLGNLYDQVTDRSVHANDVLTFSTYIPTVKDEKDAESAALKINQAISALTLNGGGPAHINLETTYSRDLSVKKLPEVRAIMRVDTDDELPLLPQGKIAVFIGSHKRFNQQATEAIDKFCYNHNAVVFCDHTSGYKGNFRQIDALLNRRSAECVKGIRLLIHMGEVSGDHFNIGSYAEEVWRLSEDGQLRDRYGKLTTVFKMSDLHFFTRYTGMQVAQGDTFIKECKAEYKKLYEELPDFPLSNIWMAKTLAPVLPEKSCIHFGILTSLRSWNFFEIPNSVNSACNVGGFGTDGSLSTILGASLVNRDKIYYCVLGDLAFFYDMNALGNRHVGKNLRILLVNNGKGCEFTHMLNPGHIFKDDVNPYIAAAGHNGNKSRALVRDYATALGFEYLTASTKDEFLKNKDRFVSTQMDKPIIFEVFTRDVDENEALRLMVEKTGVEGVKQTVKENIKGVVGQKGVNLLKGLLGK